MKSNVILFYYKGWFYARTEASGRVEWLPIKQKIPDGWDELTTDNDLEKAFQQYQNENK